MIEPQSSTVLKKWGRMVINVVLFLFFSWYIYHHGHELAILLTISWQHIMALIVVMVGYIFVNAARFSVLYRALNANVGVLESFGLLIVGTMLNLFMPQSGNIAKAVYLKQQYNLPYSQMLSLIVANAVFMLTIGAAIMLIFNVTVTVLGHTVPWVMWLSAVGAGTSIVLFWVAVPEWLTRRLGRIGNILHLFSIGWQQIAHNRRCLIDSIVYQLLLFLMAGIGIAIAYYSLGAILNPLLGVSVAVFLTFSNLIVITPGNVGINEIVVGYISSISGLTFAVGVAASVLWRVIGLLVRLLLAPMCWYFLFYRNHIELSKAGQ